MSFFDAFVLLGREQSAFETRQASQMGKPLTVIQGFGGVADEFSSTELPLATFLHF